MVDTNRSLDTALIPPDYRASGILMHVTSLPSPYGIGDLGPTSIAWIDQLVQAGQSWWQVLPLGPTGFGNSPYASLSSFAGNPLLISPDWLVEDGLLQTSDVAGLSYPPSTVDYSDVMLLKNRLLDLAWDNFKGGVAADLRPALDQFRHYEGHWLDDYALFIALKEEYGGQYYLEWPAELVRRDPATLIRVRAELAEQIEKISFSQFLLFRQARRLKAYAHDKGMRLIGDLPFFVSPDSSDVWANPEMFLLDADRRPRFVAGVPPDYFSAEGQLWGNPVYDWDALRRTEYRWWVDRLRALLMLVDVVRLDHFRAFVAAWHLPAGSTTARHGEWVPGPGADFFQKIAKPLNGLPFIAEDLGLITPDVRALRDGSHLPGMLVLQFAFDGQHDNPYFPSNHVHNAVVYTGTHDNDTTRGWYDTLPQDQRQRLWNTLQRAPGADHEVTWELIRLAWSSVAALAIAPVQDVLNLGTESRMNIPGKAENNWRWRCTQEMLASPAFEMLRELTTASKRLPAARPGQ